MKICIAQTRSLKGKVQENIQNHLRTIEYAIELGSDLVLFPELSITSYEPEIAKELAGNVEDNTFNVFQELSDKNQISIGIGMPTIAADGRNISMLIFQPIKKRMVYSKQILHIDEVPYFKTGKSQPILNIEGKIVGVGICYETMQREHLIKAMSNGAEVYIASVAKSGPLIDKAYSHFPKVAKEFNTPILMCNSVGYCDNFMSAGQSAVWNKEGELLGHLDRENQGVLTYDTESELVETAYSKL